MRRRVTIQTDHGAVARCVIVMLIAAFATAGCRQPKKEVASTFPPLPPIRLNSREIPLGPGDEIEIRVYRHDDLNQDVVVGPSGIVFVPLAGEFDVRGKSAHHLRRELTNRLDQYVRDPQVNVIVRSRLSQRAVVLGEVRQPGVVTMDRPMTVAEVIARTGGFNVEATREQVILVRVENDKPARYVLDVGSAIAMGTPEGNPEILEGDIVYVPPSTLTNIDRFAQHLITWMTPILQVQQGIILGFDIKDDIDDDFNISNEVVFPPPAAP